MGERLFAALAMMTGLACSAPRDLCVERKVSCDAPLACDPGDGECKCGGRGGVVCPTGFRCDPLGGTCQSTRCASVDCSDKPGTSCDVLDGVCKCGGTGGLTCGADQVCDPNARVCVPRVSCAAIACPHNEHCEPASGRCLCGAAECAVGERCSLAGATQAPACTADVCTGVTCLGASVCSVTDGLCACNGVVCQSGEACSCPPTADGGCEPTARACRSSSECADRLRCGNGTTCDPADGQCRCGGPGGPACALNQVCTLGPPAQCQGGDQCTLSDGSSKRCVSGTSCDPEDGRCKCGGRGGLACGSGEICIQNPVQQACRRSCDVRNPDCPAGAYCYFDSSASTPAAYCSAPTDAKVEEQGCTAATACFSTVPAARSLHCLGLVLGQTGICRAYCDLAAGNSGCVQVPVAQTCSQLPGAPTGVGTCAPH